MMSMAAGATSISVSFVLPALLVIVPAIMLAIAYWRSSAMSAWRATAEAREAQVRELREALADYEKKYRALEGQLTKSVDEIVELRKRPDFTDMTGVLRRIELMLIELRDRIVNG